MNTEIYFSTILGVVIALLFLVIAIFYGIRKIAKYKNVLSKDEGCPPEKSKTLSANFIEYPGSKDSLWEGNVFYEDRTNCKCYKCLNGESDYCFINCQPALGFKIDDLPCLICELKTWCYNGNL